MVLPLIPIAIVGAIGLAGKGVYDLFGAKKRIEKAEIRYKKNSEVTKEKIDNTTHIMDRVGERCLTITSGFKRFSEVFEKIHNRPIFTDNTQNITIPKFTMQELKDMSVGAAVLLGALGGAGVGVAGGMLAAGIAKATVVAFGIAGTGAPIAGLAGAAATNAVLAALGGGAIAAGGGGMAAGAALLGGITLGAGLIIGGVIFVITANRKCKKIQECLDELNKQEKEMEKIWNYTDSLICHAEKFEATLNTVYAIYKERFQQLVHLVEVQKVTDWNQFTPEQKLITEYIVDVVSILVAMLKTPLVIKASTELEVNKVNSVEIENVIKEARETLKINKIEKIHN